MNIDTPTLDAIKIKESIKLIDSLNLELATIKEIEELLFPLFCGLSHELPYFDEPLDIYRGRIIKNEGKPLLIKELHRPPPAEVKQLGRVNSIG